MICSCYIQRIDKLGIIDNVGILNIRKNRLISIIALVVSIIAIIIAVVSNEIK